MKKKIKCELSDYIPVKNHVSKDKNILILGEFNKEDVLIEDLSNLKEEHDNNGAIIISQEEQTTSECNESQFCDTEEDESSTEESDNDSCTDVSYQLPESNIDSNSSVSSDDNLVIITKNIDDMGDYS